MLTPVPSPHHGNGCSIRVPPMPVDASFHQPTWNRLCHRKEMFLPNICCWWLFWENVKNSSPQIWGSVGQYSQSTCQHFSVQRHSGFAHKFCQPFTLQTCRRWMQVYIWWLWCLPPQLAGGYHGRTAMIQRSRGSMNAGSPSVHRPSDSHLVCLDFLSLHLVSKAFGLTRVRGRLWFTHGPLWAKLFTYFVLSPHELCKVSVIILPSTDEETETQRA